MSDSEFGLLSLGKALLGIGVAAPVSFVSNTAIAILRSPQVLVNSYRALFKTKRIGTNLKILSGVLIPPALLLSLGLTAVGTIAYGTYRGVSSWDELNKLPKKLFKDSEDFNKHISEALEGLISSEAILELPSGLEPIDVKVIETFKSALSSLISLPISLVIQSLYALWKTPSLLRFLCRIVVKSGIRNPFAITLLLVLESIAFLLSFPAYILGSSMYTLYNVAVETYKKGLLGAVNSFSDSINSSMDTYSTTLNGSEE